MKLYEISNEMRELQAMADCGDFSAEEIADTLEAMEISQGKKVEGCLMVRADLLGDVDKYVAEAARLSAVAKQLKADAERLTDYIKHNMLVTGKDKVDAGLFKVTLRKATIKLGYIDETKIPEGYFVTVPETKKLDKRLLLADAKKGDIDGVELTQSERSLSIK